MEYFCYNLFMSKRIKTNKTGIYYRETTTNRKLDKTYYITYKDINNKFKEIKIGKYSEGIRENYCHKKRNEIITKIRLGEDSPLSQKKHKQVLIKEIKDLYFQKRKNGRSKDSDLASYNKHIDPFFKNKNLETISKNDIRKLQQKLKESKNRSKEFLSTKTIHNILTIVRSIVSFALKEELLNNDFRKYIEFDSVRNVRERYLDINEIKELYKKVEKDSTLYLFSKIALTTGARLGTILYISKKDIDFTNNIITLYDLKKDQEGRETYKSFLTDEVSSLLKVWTNTLSPIDKIFHTNPSTIQRKMLTILNELFNQGLGLNDRKNRAVVHTLRHTLRHTFASHLAINGTPIFTIQKLMNHSDIKMTLRYAKLNSESGRNSILDLKF